MSFGHTLFGFSGRLNRMAFFGYGLVLAILLGIAVGAIVFLLMSDPSGELTPELSRVFTGLTIVSLWPTAALTVKRLHDMDRTGLHAVWIFALSGAGALLDQMARGGSNAISVTLQILSLLVALWLLFARGTDGANRFGLPRQQLRAGGAYV